MPHVGHPKPLMSEDTTPFSSLYVRLSPDNFPSPPPDRPPWLPRSQDIKGFTEKLRGQGGDGRGTSFRGTHKGPRGASPRSHGRARPRWSHVRTVTVIGGLTQASSVSERGSTFRSDPRMKEGLNHHGNLSIGSPRTHAHTVNQVYPCLKE